MRPRAFLLCLRADISNNVFAFVNQNNFTAGADFGAGANCVDSFNDSATAFRSAAVASGETDPALGQPSRGRFFFERNILYNSFSNFGNASWVRLSICVLQQSVG